MTIQLRKPPTKKLPHEKLRDDLKRKYGSNSQWVERLTAIMERDA